MSKIRIGITMGDPSGVGPALIVKGLAGLRLNAEYVVIGDAWVLKQVKKGADPFSPNLIDLANVPRKGFSFGKVRASYGRASVEYLEEAVRLLKNGRIDCLVTCPISKQSVGLAGFPFPGHTEFLARRFHKRKTVMFLLNRHLKCALVTTHLPLSRIAQSLSAEKIRDVIMTTGRYLKVYFRIRAPRILVCALNPHASDNGRIGTEENRIIRPAVKNAVRLTGLTVEGPLPADTAVARAHQGRADALVCLYHDQALIPLKLTGAESGVNITLGLDFVRTSPLHGTAFDIAGSWGLISTDSFLEAVRSAVACTRAQRNA